MAFDLNKNSEKQKRIEDLAKTLRQGGFATSDTQARRMAEDMIGVEDKVQQRYEDLNKSYMEKVPGYSKFQEKQKPQQEQKVTIRKEPQKMSAETGEIKEQKEENEIPKRTPEQQKYYEQNIKTIRNNAFQKNEINVRSEYEIPNNKPLREVVEEKPADDQTTEMDDAQQENPVEESAAIEETGDEPAIEPEQEKKEYREEQKEPSEENDSIVFDDEEPADNDDEQETNEQKPAELQTDSENGSDNNSDEEPEVEVSDLEESEQKPSHQAPESASKEDTKAASPEKHDSSGSQKPQKKEDMAENSVDISEIFNFGE